jgi:hypothetical protein
MEGCGVDSVGLPVEKLALCGAENSFDGPFGNTVAGG